MLLGTTIGRCLKQDGTVDAQASPIDSPTWLLEVVVCGYPARAPPRPCRTTITATAATDTMDRRWSPTLSPSLPYTPSGPTALARCRATRASRARSIERSRTLGLQQSLPQRLRLPEEPNTGVEQSSEGAIPHRAHPVPALQPLPTRSPPTPILPSRTVMPMLFIRGSRPSLPSRALPPPDLPPPPAPAAPLRPDLKAPLTPTLQLLDRPPRCFPYFPPSPAHHHSSHPPHPERPSAGVAVSATRRRLLPRAPLNSSKAREDPVALPWWEAGSHAPTPRTRGGSLSRRWDRSCGGRWRGRRVSKAGIGTGVGR